MTAASSPPPIICSMDGCKRAVTCLCRHCQKDVCSKHFNEHQIQVNNELIPITDRLNECKNLVLFIIEFIYMFSKNEIEN